jgi:hypothetical protein
MKKTLKLLIALFFLSQNSFAQDNFPYEVLIVPVNISGVVGLHSYVYAQHDGKWLVIGGRRDGIHARQPFNAFPANQNNGLLYVIDPINGQVWSKSIAELSTPIAEQLQSTNMNFHQDGDTLYIIGGYAYSATADDHITFDKLTTIQVSSVVDAVVNNTSLAGFFKQTSNVIFANTGGQLGKIGDTFYLVGGQRFDGRYNPMNNPTFTQTYHTKIQKFKINNSGVTPTFSDYSELVDAVHLRRRDYNLLPQIFPDGTFGYMISSGVFQMTTDLPFLYPVEIKSSGYEAFTGFNQYLSHYHGAKLAMYDAENNQSHNLFFGGMSQYYYNNGDLVQDNNVPFVRTISRFSRYSDGTYQEFVLPIEMPGLKGAGSEFIPNYDASYLNGEILDLNTLEGDTIVVGFIYGGILSNSLNPFSNNQTNTTSADASIYAVKLVVNSNSSHVPVESVNPYSMRVSPNPSVKDLTIEIDMSKAKNARYLITDVMGRVVQEGELEALKLNNKETIRLEKRIGAQVLMLTVIIDGKYFLQERIVKQ